MFGAGGNPGATVNLVRKRPLRSLAAAFSTTAGSWNNYRAEADLTGPLALDGALRGRVDAAYSQRDYFFDGASLARKNLFGALELDLTARTVVTVGGSYAWADSHPFEGGLPLFPDGSDPHLPRRTGFTFDWERRHTQMREGYLRLEQRFNSAWRMKVNATALNGTSDYALGQFQSSVDPATGGLLSAPSAIYTVGPVWQRHLSAEATITGSAQWLGAREELAFGADFTHVYGVQTTVSVPAFGSPVANAYAYSPGGYPDPRTAGGLTFASRVQSSAVQSGYFGSLRVERRPWALTLGLRVSNDQATERLSVLALGQEFFIRPDRFSNIGKVTPYVGSMLALDEHFSLYASYADIYLPNTGRRFQGGSPIRPADGINMEAGVKGAWNDGALNGTVALYRTVQRGLAAYDFSATAPGGGCCYFPDGELKAKGVDVELNGTPAAGWLISAGYTFNNNVGLIPGNFYGSQTSQTPRHLLKAWTGRQLPGRLSRWSIGATLEARSSFSVAGIYCDLDASGHCPAGYHPSRTCSGRSPSSVRGSVTRSIRAGRRR